MPIGMDDSGNVVQLPYGPGQGTPVAPASTLDVADVTRDFGIKAQERALVELALQRMGQGNGTPDIGGGFA